MTGVSARSADYSDVEPLRGRHREVAGCQIVRDSILPRGLAEPYAIESGGETVGFGTDISQENHLFEDGFESALEEPGALILAGRVRGGL